MSDVPYHYTTEVIEGSKISLYTVHDFNSYIELLKNGIVEYPDIIVIMLAVGAYIGYRLSKRLCTYYDSNSNSEVV